jgi:hypothetical protein
MPDSSDVTGAAVQVRLEGPLTPSLKTGGGPSPRLFLARGRSGSCSSVRSLAIDLPRAGQSGHDRSAHDDQGRRLTQPSIH